MSNSKNTISVYGCGGMGVNLVSELLESSKVPLPGFAKMDLFFVDTSKSNLIAKEIPEDKLFLFEGKDGSGKWRPENYEDIAKYTPAVLQKLKPAAIAIVVHSAGGGSGSVIGPVLASELKNRGVQVIAVVIGSTDTRIEILNTIRTLQSYEGVAQTRKSPMVTHYLENSQERNRIQVNKDAKYAISSLAGLFSGENEELDSADLTSFLEFLKFSGGEAQLSSLNFIIGDEGIEKAGTVVSVATLARPDMSTRLGIMPAYQCVGYVPESWRKGLPPDGMRCIADEAIHFTISSDFISGAVNRLNAALNDVDADYGSRVARSSILDKNVKLTSTGVAL